MTVPSAQPAGRTSPARRRAVTAAAAVLAAAAAAFALSSCGIPLESTAQPVGQNAKVLSPTTSTTLPKTAAAATLVSVYFVKTGRLVATKRLVPPHQKANALRAALAALFAGPNTREIVTGIKSSLGQDSISLQSPPTRSRGVVTINFSAKSNFAQLSGRTEVLGIAQVVFTVAGIDPSVGVQFQLGSANLVVPTATGALTVKPVHASQYASLLAPGSQITPASTAPA